MTDTRIPRGVAMSERWVHVDSARALESLAEANGTEITFTAAFATTELPDGCVYFTERNAPGA